MEFGPVFVGGAHRSGTTLMSALLTSHPRIAVSNVEPNMWTHFYGKYGDLGQPANFERCFSAMLSHRGTRALNPNPDRVSEEFWQGEPTYGRLFGILQRHYAEQMCKPRWGDKTPNLERYADAIFAAYPMAKMLHMIRDPRDRYLSRTRWGKRRHRLSRRLGRVGGSTARWLYSVGLAERNQEKHPGQYRIVRYETLVLQSEEVMRDVCDFLGEPYIPAMLKMEGRRTFRSKGGNSSFVKHNGISTASVGRFRQRLSGREIAFIQAQARKAMGVYGYDLEALQLSFAERLLLYSVDWPVNLFRMSLLSSLESMRSHSPVASGYVDRLLGRI